MSRDVHLQHVRDLTFSAVTTLVSRRTWFVTVSRTVCWARTRSTVPRSLRSRVHVTRSRVRAEDVPRGVMGPMNVLTAVMRSIVAMTTLTNLIVEIMNVLIASKSVMARRTVQMAWMSIQNVVSTIINLYSMLMIMFACMICPLYKVSMLSLLVGLCLAPNYRCSDGRCISGLLVCDGEFDCTDGSDEKFC